VSLSTSNCWSRLHELARRGPLRAALTVSLAAGLLVACADEQGGEEDRRFANQPVTEQVTIAGVDASPESGPVPTPKSLPSPEALLNVRGAPSIVYAIVDGRVLAVDTSEPARSSWIPVDTGATVVDLVSSPSGGRLAILQAREGAADIGFEVVLYGAEGTEHGRWSLPVSPRQAATPVVAGAPGSHAQGSITWSADGSSLLVAMNGDTLVAIELDGEAEVLPVPANMPRFTVAAWSPAGDLIGVLASDEREGGRVLVFDPDNPALEAEQIAPPTADTSGTGSVAQFAWLPNGSGLAYLMADEQRSTEPGGSLYIHDERTGQRRLVATPGRGGPAAQIIDFEVSPDGKAVAYVIATPEGDSWRFNSLWVRSLKGSQAFPVPVVDTLPVTSVWWIDSGLAWAQEGESFRIDVAAPVSGTQTLVTLSPETAATPVISSTPGAGDNATPVGSPPAIATPVSATPDAATPAGTPTPATPLP
jgi:hypothetical protein